VKILIADDIPQHEAALPPHQEATYKDIVLQMGVYSQELTHRLIKRTRSLKLILPASIAET
jgi:hypothetical protein